MENAKHYIQWLLLVAVILGVSCQSPITKVNSPTPDVRVVESLKDPVPASHYSFEKRVDAILAEDLSRDDLLKRFRNKHGTYTERILAAGVLARMQCEEALSDIESLAGSEFEEMLTQENADEGDAFFHLKDLVEAAGWLHTEQAFASQRRILHAHKREPVNFRTDMVRYRGARAGVTSDEANEMIQAAVLHGNLFGRSDYDEMLGVHLAITKDGKHALCALTKGDYKGPLYSQGEIYRVLFEKHGSWWFLTRVRQSSWMS